MRALCLFVLLVGCEPTVDDPKGDSGDAQDTQPADDTGPAEDTGPATQDADGDGFIDDCDDNNPDVYPGAAEFCDGLDNDCNNIVDDDAVDAATWYADTDGDGFGDADQDQVSCDMPTGFVANDSDCDDTDARFNPGAIESDCEDPSDYNCDGSVGFADADGDGFAACTECDDDDAAVNPDAVEICNDVDDDCNGLADDEDPLLTGGSTWYADADGDSYGGDQFTLEACVAPDGWVDNSDDCDDLEALTYPSASEVCDEQDNDCDGTVDEGVGFTWYADTDGDGYGDASSSSTECNMPPGYSANGDDCNDSEATTNPAAYEVCDGVDNNCDGTADENTALDAGTWYTDADGDGYGDSASATTACDMSSNASAVGGDCDDADANSWPGADEVCDSADNDCDGTIDEYAVDRTSWYTDADGDGYGNPSSTTLSCDMPSGAVADNSDCNDANGQVNPAATETWYDGIDSDCDGGSDYDADQDGAVHDGYGGSDCNDADATINPAAAETWYDGVDQNCDSASDYDADGDGSDSDAWSGTDCNDTDATVNTAATETWYDGIDQDCDGANDYDADADGEDSDAWNGTDCNDSDATINTAATETWYDGADQNCDGLNDFDQDGDGYDATAYGGLDMNDTDANCWDSCIDGSTQANAGQTCQTLAADYPTGASGVYWIDPDNDGDTSNAFEVYCDLANGGWTRCLYFENTSGHDLTGNNWFDDCVDYTSASWTGSEVRVHLMDSSNTTVYDQSGSRGNSWTYQHLTSNTGNSSQFHSPNHNNLVTLGNSDKLMIPGRDASNSGCGGSFGNGYGITVYPTNPNYYDNPKILAMGYEGGINGNARNFQNWSQSHEISWNGGSSFNTCNSTPSFLGQFEFYVR